MPVIAHRVVLPSSSGCLSHAMPSCQSQAQHGCAISSGSTAPHPAIDVYLKMPGATQLVLARAPSALSPTSHIPLGTGSLETEFAANLGGCHGLGPSSFEPAGTGTFCGQASNTSEAEPAAQVAAQDLGFEEDSLDEEASIFDAQAAAVAKANAAAAAAAGTAAAPSVTSQLIASASAPPATRSAKSSLQNSGSSAASSSSIVHSGMCASYSHGVATTLASAASGVSSGFSMCSSSRRSLRDQNSVTIKATTIVKDAAGAIDKILSRGVTALVTALRGNGSECGSGAGCRGASAYESLNQAVKAIAVARQYAKETGPAGAEVTFLPFNRYDGSERPDPSRFAFLVFPLAHLLEPLKTADETVLNVARGSDVHKMASAIIAVMLDRGQAVMKAAGSEAIFVAMSAVVNARHRLVSRHSFDLMLTASWITEDTVSTMGRESKFLRFNILKTEPAGPKSQVAPSLPAFDAC